jgi:hypothetical protein
VTTIIGRFRDSAALLKWNFTTGFSQGVLCGKGQVYSDDPFAVAREAANLGTIAHGLVDDHIHGRVVTLGQQDPRVVSAYNAYLEWESQTHIKVIETEMQLISEKYHFGGTPDAIGEMNGKLVLLDWKTSNSVYADHLIQLAAYRLLWDETHPDRPLTGGSHLLRFSKEESDFAHHSYPDLADAQEQFLLFRRCYELDKRLQKRTR